MEASVKDLQTVSADGEALQPLLDGMSFRDVPLHVDDRGHVCEMYDERWVWHDAPLSYVYFSSIRPGVIKGWALHERHEDRYFVMSGDLEVVLYDVRPESSTFQHVRKIYLSEHRRRLVNIPTGVWHADRNVGERDCVIVNFPTLPYDHADPDKFRLPLDTDQIPFSFGAAAQGW
jgi:dTDP-4-dehydrorhamnose 3,5-epimerase